MELSLLGFAREQYVGQPVESFVYMDLEKVDSNNYLNCNLNSNTAGSGNSGQQPVSFVNDRILYKEVLKQITSGHAVHDVPIRFVTYSGTVLHLILDCDAVPIPYTSNLQSTTNNDGSSNSNERCYYYRCFTRDDTARRIQEMRSNVLFQETNRSLQMLDNFMNRSMVRMHIICSVYC